MAKRGRPRKDGRQPFMVFIRMISVIDAYNKARKSGEKHSSAVTEAVAAVRAQWPEMPISETVVKRILAEYYPKGSPMAFRVTEISEPLPLSADLSELAGLPPDTRIKRSFVVGFGPRLNYPRANARTSKKVPPTSKN
jgi:hypothetical protein